MSLKSAFSPCQYHSGKVLSRSIESTLRLSSNSATVTPSWAADFKLAAGTLIGPPVPALVWTESWCAYLSIAVLFRGVGQQGDLARGLHR